MEEVESWMNVVSSPEYKRVDLAAGRSAQTQYIMALTLPDAQAKTVTVFTYLITKDKDAFVITFGAAADQASDYAPVFEKIAQSFRWVK